jgi:ATP synthase protein I
LVKNGTNFDKVCLQFHKLFVILPAREIRAIKMDKSTLRALAIISQLGLSIAIPLAVGIFLGVWLDGQFHTSPWLTLAGIALGMVVAVFTLAQLVRFQRDPEEIARDRANFAAKAQQRADAAKSQADTDQRMLGLFGGDDEDQQDNQNNS